MQEAISTEETAGGSVCFTSQKVLNYVLLVPVAHFLLPRILPNAQ